jgi:hypothetical protein
MMRGISSLLLAAVVVFVPVAAGFAADAPSFSPYVERYEGGWIDWSEGAIYGIGRGDLQRHSGSRPMARRAAKIIALKSILRIAAGIHVDDRRTIQDLSTGSAVIELEALIHFTVHREGWVQNATRPYFESVLRAPMTGISGLTGRLVGALGEGAPSRKVTPPTPGEPLPDEDAPWIVFDARLPGGAAARPALFPKIVSESGRVVYDRPQVDETALVARGMARYVTLAGPTDRLLSQRSRAARLIARLWSTPEAAAGEKGGPKKRRRYIVTDVAAVQGLARTNLVISEQDAERLRAEDAASRILKRCRVIVIVSSPTGGVEGRRIVSPPEAFAGLASSGCLHLPRVPGSLTPSCAAGPKKTTAVARHP